MQQAVAHQQTGVALQRAFCGRASQSGMLRSSRISPNLLLRPQLEVANILASAPASGIGGRLSPGAHESHERDSPAAGTSIMLLRAGPQCGMAWTRMRSNHATEEDG
jgi:hypothetical protein